MEDKKKPRQFALIIGAMKSGTTSMFEILGQHPEICLCKHKEPDYFTKDHADYTNYLDLWNWQEGKHKISLESSVSYTKHPFVTGVPERIAHSNLGDFRFIYMLREPLSRIESQARHAIFAGWGKSLDTEMSKDLLDYSRYSMQLDEYTKYFAKNKILIITLEEFSQNSSAVLTKVCNFLGVSEDFIFNKADKPRNSGDFFNAPKNIAKITQGKVGQFISKKIIPKRIKNILRNIIAFYGRKRGGDTKQDNRWKLNNIERNDVTRKLASDLKRLNTEYGVDTSRYWVYSNKD